MRRWVVRVVTDRLNHGTQEPVMRGLGGFIEALRHAGLVKLHFQNDVGGFTFDMLPPAIHKTTESTKLWAESNAARMATFGFNAVAAPEWKSVDGPVVTRGGY